VSEILPTIVETYELPYPTSQRVKSAVALPVRTTRAGQEGILEPASTPAMRGYTGPGTHLSTKCSRAGIIELWCSLYRKLQVWLTPTRPRIKGIVDNEDVEAG